MHAGVFALTSEVASYHFAKRHFLLTMPPEKQAARITKDHEAGIVVLPSDENAFVQAAGRLFADKALRENLAKNGRLYADSAFDIQKITDRFEDTIMKNTN